jgi:RNA polymerase sigma factor (sigma-70 family)
LDEELTPAQRAFEFLDVDDALETLATLDPRGAKIIELRFFGGLTLDETAEVLGVSRRTVANDWVAARAWLSRELSGGESPRASA